MQVVRANEPQTPELVSNAGPSNYEPPPREPDIFDEDTPMDLGVIVQLEELPHKRQKKKASGSVGIL